MEAFSVSERLLEFLECPEEKVLRCADRPIHSLGDFLHLKPLDSSQYYDLPVIGAERRECPFEALESFTAPNNSTRRHFGITFADVALKLKESF